MTDVPTITLGDEQTTYDKEAGEYDSHLPVTIRVDDKEQAREVAEVFTEAWRAEKGGGDE